MTEETLMIKEQTLKANKPHQVEMLEVIPLSPMIAKGQVRCGELTKGFGEK